MTDDIIEGAIIRVKDTPRDLSTDLRQWAVATAMHETGKFELLSVADE